ncbi:MAG: aminotransferase, partial [Lachnospiraceae bacterium]|nr:aminotransferase [Lachnospiraceae bacterium]
PDMDKVEFMVSNDDSIKGIWCVPKYSNPDGISYSDETVKRFARLKPKAKDFRIFWDNAYTVHHLYEDKQDYILEILTECKKCGTEDMVYKFGSTSKITFPGSGIASMAASEKNIEEIISHLKVQTIGYDKVNQLRHARFFKDINGIKEHMKKHADILRPKFEMVEKIFDEELIPLSIAHFTKPRGGYFISLYTMDGVAKATIKKCLDIGVKLTDAGASFPYHKDPHDSNIRIAPSYPDMDSLRLATKVVVLSIKLCTIEKLLYK